MASCVETAKGARSAARSNAPARAADPARATIDTKARPGPEGSSWRTVQEEPRTAAAGGCARAREERAEGDRVHGARDPRSRRRPRSASRTRRSTRAWRSTARRGDYDSFRRWTVVPDEEHEEPAHQIAITDAAERDPEPQARRRHRGAARAGRVRPHRRAGGEAGDPAEDPRRRARADPERLPRARGQPADRHRQAHRARQRDRRVGPHRGRDPARPADPEGDAARRRPRARLRAEDRPHGEGPAAHPVAHRRPSS